MTAIFREAHDGDLDELLDVRAATRENAMTRAQLARRGITAASMAESMARGTLKGWVCSSDSRIVGFCMGDSEQGEVAVLAILPEYEGRGIGKTLLSLVVEWLCSFNPESVWLGTSPNPATRAYGFYRALGWRPIGETDAHGDEILVLVTRHH